VQPAEEAGGEVDVVARTLVVPAAELKDFDAEVQQLEEVEGIADEYVALRRAARAYLKRAGKGVKPWPTD
jgi:hypothetical protein